MSKGVDAGTLTVHVVFKELMKWVICVESGGISSLAISLPSLETRPLKVRTDA